MIKHPHKQEFLKKK